jgi:hypothetical protein
MEKELTVSKDNQKKKKKIRTRVILVLIVMLILAVCTYISYRGTYLETIEVGENFKQVFDQNIFYQYATAGVNFIILFIAIYFTNRGIKKGLKAFFDEEKKDMPKLPNKSIAFILSAIISVIISCFMSNQVALFFNRTWFGIYDPIFGADISFYIFEKTFIELILVYLMVLIVALTAYTALYYIIVFNVYFDGINSDTLKKSKLFKQISRNIKIFAIVLAVFILVTAQGILTDKFLVLNDDSSTALYGAGITDTTIKLWGYRILAIVIVIAVWQGIKYFKERKSKNVIIAILSIPAYLVCMFIVMTGFKLIYINSNELDKEKWFIQNNIDYTKTAYNIKIDEIEIDDGGTRKLKPN